VAATLAGAGIAYVAEDVIRDDLISGRLVRVLPRYEVPQLGPLIFSSIPIADRRRSCAAFIDVVVSEFGTI